MKCLVQMSPRSDLSFRGTSLAQRHRIAVCSCGWLIGCHFDEKHFPDHYYCEAHCCGPGKLHHQRVFHDHWKRIRRAAVCAIESEISTCCFCVWTSSSSPFLHVCRLYSPSCFDGTTGVSFPCYSSVSLLYRSRKVQGAVALATVLSDSWLPLERRSATVWERNRPERLQVVRLWLA